jgi:hypothetical protein
MSGFRAAAATALTAALVIGGASPAMAKVKITSMHYNAGSSVLTNSGRDTRKNLYWGLSRMRWNDGPSGDTAYLDNRKGTTVSTCSYTPATDPSPAAC